MEKHLLLTAGALLGGMAVVAAAPKAKPEKGKEQERPNFIVILVDDMGYSDLGCFGSEISTPNLDRMASQGMRFEQFYSNPRSCPSRASLMTGMYPTKAGLGQMSHNSGVPEYQGYLRSDCMTMGEMLKSNGYATYLSGKWHLGIKKGQWPCDRGFDRSFVFLGGATDYFSPGDMAIDDKPIEITDPNFYLTNAISDNAVEFIKDEKGRDGKPFFMYVAFNAPHWPLQAPKADYEKYLDVYAAGWDVIRQKRYEKQLANGAIPPGTKLSARNEEVPAWNSLGKEEQKDWVLCMALYAAMVDIMDRGVGKIVEQLRSQGILDNTLIMFMSDNGACDENGNNRRKIKDAKPGEKGSALGYKAPWANVSATPFRYFKKATFEGGIHAPCIMQFPNMIKGGGNCTVQAHIIDVLPTMVDLCGGTAPDSYNGNKVNPMDGASMRSLFSGGTAPIHDRLCWQHLNNSAIRKGDWKLVGTDCFRSGKIELFDISKDKTELNDLSAQHSDIVKELLADYKVWMKENKVIPWKDLSNNKSNGSNKNNKNTKSK